MSQSPVPIDNLEELIKLLPSCSNTLPPDFLKFLNEESRTFMDNIRSKANQFLHDLDSQKHTEDQVEKVVDLFPSSLSSKNEYGMLPIQAAAFCSNRKSFIPLLAEKGIAQNIGGHGSRGGLLNEVPTATEGKNIIQCLANFGASDEQRRDEFDRKDLAVLKDLRSRKLLLKEDIYTMNLLVHSCFSIAQRRFWYLVDWNPKVLKRTRWIDSCSVLIHDVIESQSTVEGFNMVLTAGIKHYPNELGFLLKACENTKAPYELTREKFGTQETMAVVKKCIPCGNGFSVLDDVVKHCPQVIDDFVTYYGEDISIRNGNGHLLIHTKLSQLQLLQ